MKKEQKELQADTISIPLEIISELDYVQECILEDACYNAYPYNIRIYARLKMACLALYLYCYEQHGVSMPCYFYDFNYRKLETFAQAIADENNTEDDIRYDYYNDYLDFNWYIYSQLRDYGWEQIKRATVGHHYMSYEKLPDLFPFYETYFSEMIEKGKKENCEYNYDLCLWRNKKLQAYLKYASSNKIEKKLKTAINICLQNIGAYSKSQCHYAIQQGGELLCVFLNYDMWDSDDIFTIELSFPIHLYNLEKLLNTAISLYGITVSEKGE